MVNTTECYTLLQLDRFQRYTNLDRSQESRKDSGMHYLTYTHCYLSVYICVTRNLSSHTMCPSHTTSSRTWPQQPCDCDGFCNHVTLTFDLLTSASMHAKQLP